jgi:hypothetical protein
MLDAEDESPFFVSGFDVYFIDSTMKCCYSDVFELEGRSMQHTEPSHLYLRLDLTRPLGPQLGALTQIAKRAQKPWTNGKKEIRRPHTRKWPLYLRVLDARDAGASYATIARALLTHQNRTEQAARDVVKQAEALRNDWPYYSQ